MPIFEHCAPRSRPNARVISCEQWMQDLVNDKLRKFVARRYIELVHNPKEVKVAIVYFPVQKGDSDIRMVWSETETGVNETVFAPNFFLPTLDTLIRRLPNNAWLGDFDVGEMFHNFSLHHAHRGYHGVNFPQPLWKEFGARFGVWVRLPMGFRSSPYIAGRVQTRALEIARGHPSTEGNPFGFGEVKLNLPMSTEYDPTQPWVQKIRGDGGPAGDVLMYVDDGRPFGASEHHANACMRQICSRLEYLGIQDAKRKRRPVSQRAGAWAGGVVFTDKGVPRKFLSQSRWERLKDCLNWLQSHIDDPGGFERQELLKVRGFIVYASMTYTFAVPFLKGVHLTVDAWRANRDLEGWKERQGGMNDREPVALTGETSIDLIATETNEGGDEFWEPEFVAAPGEDKEDLIAEGGIPGSPVPGEAVASEVAPSRCKPVPRLRSDLLALLKLFSGSSPIMIPIRPTRAVSLVYGFGDASGEGFGSAIGFGGFASNGVIRVRRGFWCTAISEQSSNYREFHNLLDAVEDLATTGSLEGAEVYLFTDNSTSESVYYTGSSDSPELFELLLSLRTLALEVGFNLHIIHIAGTRMIAQGTDGLSRGELQLGSLSNLETQVVPLHLDPVMRTSGGLAAWVYDWTGLDPVSLPVATPKDWMYEAHMPGFWIWSLPPAAAIYALEELGFAKLKRGEDVGAVVLVPSLMKPYWFRRFVRTVDLYFTVPAGHPRWPACMHESLTIGLLFPLLRYEPWSWRRVPFMVGLGRTLSSLHKTDHNEARDLLCKFWAARSRASRLPARVVCPLLQRPHFHPFLSLSK
jgi:hypothetical protein